VATAAENLFEKALQLPASDRAHLAADLLASLDADADDEASVDEAWSQETTRRAQLIETGQAQLVTWDHVEERIAEHRSPRPSG
jgi:putative addiction module component (TIGR02574 family)